jgi:hypothetical protein
MDKRNFKSTKNTRRSEKVVLGIFGEGIFKSGVRISSWYLWRADPQIQSENQSHRSLVS